MNFLGKKVYITGGSSGIGLSMAQLFSQKGAHVLILARNEDRLESALKQLKSGNHQAISLDVTDANRVLEVVNRTISQFGSPDILVNCAGVAHPGYVQELDIKIYQWMMDVNYFGTVNMTKAILPNMLSRGEGHIVNIGSVTSYIGVFGYSAYGASKFAIRGFSDSLRAEVKPRGINVSIVYPPDTDTPQLAYEEQYKPVELKYLFPELGVVSPDQVAEKVLSGIARNQYVIHADLGSRLLYRLAGLLVYGVYPLQDFLVKRAQRRINKKK